MKKPLLIIPFTLAYALFGISLIQQYLPNVVDTDNSSLSFRSSRQQGDVSPIDAELNFMQTNGERNEDIIRNCILIYRVINHVNLGLLLYSCVYSIFSTSRVLLLRCDSHNMILV